MKVTAAVATAPKAPFELRELELDEPRAGEVQVRMVATGVCHTDAIVRDAWYPFPMPAVLGHEGAGIVERIGEGVTTVQPGDAVVLAPAYCGHCRQCLTGHPSYCENAWPLNFGGRRADGSSAFTEDGEPVSSHFFGQSSFASVANVFENNVVKVPGDLPIDLLGPLGCGIQTGAGSVLNVLRPEPGSSIAIFGTGAVGCAAMLAAIAAGVTTVVMVDIVESRLEFAKGLGATHTVNSREVDPVEAVRAVTGRGVDYALDTTGNKHVFPQMLGVLAARGHGGLVGAAALGTEASIDIGSLLTSGITISMISEGDSVPQRFIPQLIDLYRAGRFPFDRLVKRYPFAEIDQAFEDSEKGATLKPVLVF
jgi:aryl-alcohol dehydrogenase